MSNSTYIDRLSNVCLICLKPTDISTLKSNHHCCKRSNYCRDRFNEIVEWEKDNLGQSLIYELSSVY